jgi:hypothetical protein
MTRRLIHQECHGVILWDKPKSPSNNTSSHSWAGRTKVPFSHDIPPAPEVKPRWNYPVDPPKIRSTQHLLIEKHAQSHKEQQHEQQEQEKKNEMSSFSARQQEQKQSGRPPTALSTSHSLPINSSRKYTRPHSATPSNLLSSQPENHETRTSITSRPLSAPKARLHNEHEIPLPSEDFPSTRTTLSHQSRSSTQLNSPAGDGIATVRSSRPPLATTAAPNRPSSSTLFRSATSPSSFDFSATSWTPQSSHRPSSANQQSYPGSGAGLGDRSRPPHQSSSSKKSSTSFVANPLFKSKKKTYFDFKRIPPTDLYEPTTQVITGGPHPGSLSRAPPCDLLVDPLAQEAGKGAGKKWKGKKNVPPSQSSSSSVVLGRSQDTARVHLLIDDMMMKLASAATAQERIAIKQEFTHYMTRFAQQPSKGGDY